MKICVISTSPRDHVPLCQGRVKNISPFKTVLIDHRKTQKEAYLPNRKSPAVIEICSMAV